MVQDPKLFKALPQGGNDVIFEHSERAMMVFVIDTWEITMCNPAAEKEGFKAGQKLKLVTQATEESRRVIRLVLHKWRAVGYTGLNTGEFVSPLGAYSWRKFEMFKVGDNLGYITCWSIDREIRAGQEAIASKHAMQQLLATINAQDRRKDPNRVLQVALTPTEWIVAKHLLKDKTSQEIADIMGVAYRTVEFHRANIRKKLGVAHKGNLQNHLRSLGFNVDTHSDKPVFTESY